MTAKEKKLLKIIHKAIKKFPQTVRLKKKRAEQKKKFAEKTFGPLVRQLLKKQKQTT